MSEQALWLDGNALAGLLAELFGAEMTTAERGCSGCGERRAVGAHRLYQSAGMVLRCPVCNDMAMLIAELPDRHVVRLTGAWAFSAPRSG
jgi:uncharacterized protein DUF6510